MDWYWDPVAEEVSYLTSGGGYLRYSPASKHYRHRDFQGIQQTAFLEASFFGTLTSEYVPRFKRGVDGLEFEEGQVPGGLISAGRVETWQRRGFSKGDSSEVQDDCRLVSVGPCF